MPETNVFIDVLKRHFEKVYGVFVEQVDASASLELSGPGGEAEAPRLTGERERTKLLRFIVRSTALERLRARNSCQNGA